MRIAVVGAGVSGLVVARHLHSSHDVTVLESGERPGGHIHTWDVTLQGERYALDSGFIVYNERNYPNFTRLLGELGVATRSSTMSFSVRHDASGVEYNGSTLRKLFVQPWNIARPAFLRMIHDIIRFNREAIGAIAAGGTGLTLGDLLDRAGYSRSFQEWYLLPMGSAIWSVPTGTVRAMPARFFVEFFRNHGMLTVDQRPEWRVIRGGSARYMEALIAPFRDRIRLRHPVRFVVRTPGGVLVDGVPYDRVVFACHSDEALAILGDATRAEREVLSALPYETNDAVVHTDRRLLPVRRSAWGAWNYLVSDEPGAPATVTYLLNQLQSLPAPVPFCVTLNDRGRIDPALVIGRARYAHPIATMAGERARQRRGEISGVGRTHFAGAYWGNGFHEDGVVSALAVVEEIVGAAASTARVA
jgi:predicted NAD/FAD-binding protein